MSRAAFAAVASAVAIAIPASAAESPVTVDPEAGPPDTAFHVEVPALYRVTNKRDRYWFVVRGPGGRRCDGSVTSRLGITPAGRPKRVGLSFAGVRVVTKKEIVPGDWCVGTFRGHVEFRDWRPRSHRYVIKRIGSFSWTVNSTEG